MVGDFYGLWYLQFDTQLALFPTPYWPCVANCLGTPSDLGTIGYEHTFVHTVADFVTAIHTGAAIRPDFGDGLRVIAVLEAALESAASGRQITVSSIHSPEGVSA